MPALPPTLSLLTYHRNAARFLKKMPIDRNQPVRQAMLEPRIEAGIQAAHGKFRDIVAVPDSFDIHVPRVR